MSLRIVPPPIKRMLLMRNCPSEELLAAYADQRVTGDEKTRIERHVSSCDACLRQVSFLVRTEYESEQAPTELVRKAIAIGEAPAPRRSRRWRWLAAAAAAAVVAAVTLYGPRQETRRQANESTGTPGDKHAPKESSASEAQQPAAGVLRGGQSSTDSILIVPKPDERLDARNTEFRWKSMGDATFYEIEVLSDSGDVIWRQRSSSTSVKLPATVHLEQGKTYFVWIRIHTSRGSVEQSRAVPFQVG